MFREPKIKSTGFEDFVAADRGFTLTPSRQTVLSAVASLLDAAEVHGNNSIGRIPSTRPAFSKFESYQAALSSL
jgi:hypothetical protein